LYLEYFAIRKRANRKVSVQSNVPDECVHTTSWQLGVAYILTSAEEGEMCGTCSTQKGLREISWKGVDWIHMP